MIFDTPGALLARTTSWRVRQREAARARTAAATIADYGDFGFDAPPARAVFFEWSNGSRSDAVTAAIAALE